VIDSDTIVKHQDNERKIRLPLVTKNSERIEFLFEEEIFWKNKMVDTSQINMKEIIRKYSKEEVSRLMNEIIKNNKTILKLQKQILGVEEMTKEKRRQKEKKHRERQKEEEENDRWIEECRRRNEKKREEREEQKRVDEE